MSARHLKAVAALAALAVPMPSAINRSGSWGYAAPPEEIERRKAERLARKDRLVAKAEAKRARKAAKRLAAVSLPGDEQP